MTLLDVMLRRVFLVEVVTVEEVLKAEDVASWISTVNNEGFTTEDEFQGAESHVDVTYVEATMMTEFVND